MSEKTSSTIRCFTSYSGIKLPLKLVNELGEEELDNRNTYYRAHYNDKEQMIVCQKIVYGEIEQEHRYQYHENGVLKMAEISEGDDEVTVIGFDPQGNPC